MNRHPQARGMASGMAALLLAASLAHAADIEAQAPAAVRRGLDWLRDMQQEDGSWSNADYPALSALCLWAFARSDHPDRTGVCARAAGFVAKFAQEDGGIYKPATGGRSSGGLSTYNTAICMIALHACDRAGYAPLILKAREFMARCQLAGDSPGAGGFGYNQPSPAKNASATERPGPPDRADLSNTGWAVHAMRVSQDLEDLRSGRQAVDIDWKAALKFVEKLQNREKDDAEHYGGFGYEQGGSRGGTFVGKRDGTVKLSGYGSMTYAGLESMIYAQVDRTDPRVRSALQWAARHWSVDENPGMGQKGLFYYYNIMAKALSLSGSDTLRGAAGETIPWKKDLVAKLIAVQQPDGSWVNADNQFWEGDPVLCTAYSLLALQMAL